MMEKYTIHDAKTGEITGGVFGNIRHIPPGSSYIEGFWDSDQYSIVDGKPLRKEDEVIARQEEEDLSHKLRRKRNLILSRTDWTQMPDAPLDAAKKEEWKVYRQQLRDLPANTVDPRQVEWPTPPY